MNFTKDLLNCSVCKKRVQEPVVLPCGHHICKKHQNEPSNTKNELTCEVCYTSHVILETGFTPSFAVEQLLKMQLDQIDMGEEHRRASKAIANLESISEELRKIKDNPEIAIYEKISALKNQVALDREELKDLIDKEADRLINELDEFEMECKPDIVPQSKKIKLSSEIQSSIGEENELESWKSQLYSFKKNVSEWNDITKKCNSLIETSKKELTALQTELFMGKLDEIENINLFQRSFGLWYVYLIYLMTSL